MTRSLPIAGAAATRPRLPLARTAYGAPAEQRLYFAQVHEDPLLEIEALAPRADGRYVVVSSGGCTALSLLAAGAGQVISVDLNPAQNHLVELKAAACRLGDAPAVAFLGGAPSGRWTREAAYLRVRDLLTPGARAYWDRRRRAVRRGVLSIGVTEKFMGLIAAVVRRFVHTPDRVAALLACRTLDEQRAFYEQVWDTRRWRALYALLVNRWVMTRTYHPAFFEHVDKPSFAAHFLALARRTLTTLPVRTNYFLHHLLTGRYPAGDQAALPPYLTRDGSRAVADGRSRLSLADGSVVDLLRAQPAGSLDGFSLSNIAEWMDPAAQAELFGEIARAARPGARLAFRNFVGWTEIPAALRSSLVVDEPLGQALSARDRSLVQRRIVVARMDAGDQRVPS
jgi:S-adenosylmethionine-diacylglycerol 3-amino-3-carboxypropyl transferase